MLSVLPYFAERSVPEDRFQQRSRVSPGHGSVTLSNGSRTNIQEIYVHAAAVTAFHMLDASLRNWRNVLREIR